ncbi:MAG: HlyD family efflux transporter periplasmic adaptor subunit [Candidatus Omnitrophica bacterium]|nr:HlyD family efflux transporter periplasmic adaptor subunit [Candidatus Omnitrophota bacterium]
MKEKTAHEAQPYEEEPSLFEEKPAPSRKKKGKTLFVFLVLAMAFVFWPKGQIQGDAVLQAERFARIGLTSSGVLTDLLHEKGEHVKKGEVIVRFQNEELKRKFREKELGLEILKLEKDQLVKSVEFRSQEKMRAQILFENGVIGRAELDQTVHELDEVNRRLETKTKEIESAENELAYMKSRIESLEIKAPFDGVLLTDPSPSMGNSFKEGEFVLEFADPESYLLEVLIPEKQIHKIKPGDSVKARFHAFPWAAYDGEVVRISPRITDEIEKVFNVRYVVACEIKLRELPTEVRYGMRASVRIKTKGRRDKRNDS